MTELWYVLSASVAAVSASVAFVTWRALDFANKLDVRERGLDEPDEVEEGDSFEDRAREEDRLERLEDELEHARELDAKARRNESAGSPNVAAQYRLMAYQARERIKKLEQGGG